MSPIVEVNLEDHRWTQVCDPEALARTAVEAVMTEIEVRQSGYWEVSFLFCDDEKIRSLNAAWNKKDTATNVLSFPAAPVGNKGPVSMLGDVIIAFDTISKEAGLQHKPIHAHASHMLVHGVLHLFGFDHMTESDAVEMESLETQILSVMGIPDPSIAQDNSEHSL